MKLRPCLQPGCPELTTARRCPVHARIADRAIKARTSPHRIYNSPRWKGLRRSVLRDSPWCQCDVSCCPDGCRDMATDVDHIIPTTDDETLWWDRTNLQALSKRCHSRKTAREVQRR